MDEKTVNQKNVRVNTILGAMMAVGIENTFVRTQMIIAGVINEFPPMTMTERRETCRLSERPSK